MRTVLKFPFKMVKRSRESIRVRVNYFLPAKRVWLGKGTRGETMLLHTHARYLILSSRRSLRSTDSCWMRESSTGCERGQGLLSNTSSRFTCWQRNITRWRSEVERASSKAALGSSEESSLWISSCKRERRVRFCRQDGPHTSDKRCV